MMNGGADNQTAESTVECQITYGLLILLDFSSCLIPLH